MTLEDLDRADTRPEYKGCYGESLTRLFNYLQPFGLQFRYRHQVDDQNNIRHAPTSIERTWATKLWLDRNFACYLAVNEVNMALADGHFRKGRQLISSLQLQRKLAHDMMDNTFGVNTVYYRMPRR